MRPITLKMRAFGSYGSLTTIHFDGLNQNLFLITGDTGAGKTTIFDAIVFALYGETGSSSNKKDGIVLQSQYTAYDQEPFVELTFSEGRNAGRRSPEAEIGELHKSGAEGVIGATAGAWSETAEWDVGAVYTVRRVPRHLRLLTRGAGKGSGTREVTGSVSLEMPDGSEYPQKEADKKLEEIVGLTKGQFMQVAMIAQGEFMELLRAKSDDKKVIFRKLFHTDLYRKIEEEMGNRKKEKEKEIADIRMVCQTEMAHVRIPEEYEDAKSLSQLKKRVSDGEMSMLAPFLESLGELCQFLTTEQKAAAERLQKRKEVQNAKRDAYTSAQNLALVYAQLETAQRELAIYVGQESEMADKRRLTAQLRAAFEIRTEYQRYCEAFKTAETAKESQKQLKDALPIKEQALRQAEEAQEKEQKALEERQAELARIGERVKRALELFQKMEEADALVQANEAALRTAEKNAAVCEKNLEKLETQERLWREQEQQLGDTPEKIVLWHGKREALERLSAEMAESERMLKAANEQTRKSQQAKKQYQKASEAYQQAKEAYERARTAFLDAQAGILARDLRMGEPCPVCGSTEHPHLASWGGEFAELTQEELERLSEKAEACSEKQKKQAAASQAAAELLAEKQEILRRQMKKLRETLESTAARMQSPDSASGTDSAVIDWPGEDTGMYFERTIAQIADWAERQNQALLLEQTELERKQTDYNTVRRSLSLVDGKRQELREKVETAKAALTEAKANLEGSRQKRKTLDASGLFASKEEAERSLNDAKAACRKQETANRRAADAAKKAKEEIDRTSALIRKYEQELPGQEQFVLDRRESYKRCMKEKKLSKEEWQELTRTHAPEEETSLREQIELYTQRKTAAESRAAAAKETIGDRPKPEPEGLKAELQEAERRTNEAQEQFARIGEISRADEHTYLALSAKQNERSRAIEEHTRLDTLYRLISGNVKDSRMDLETFVQRYYMERILHAANRRFLEMSGGQFELRMVDAQMAGKGKNRGLDLMVYSTVTGKEREIRTLSGGESFMAALSLALGMADQIQQSTASIHLDMMFIDEGFGSLDDHSRNQAVRVLQEMAGSDRLIGIISHVTELKQEIDDQLVVTRDETGSHVRWQIS